MNLYNLTLVFAEIFGVILGSIWIVYKISSMNADDLLLNIATYSLLLYVAIGNLLKQLLDI